MKILYFLLLLFSINLSAQDTTYWSGEKDDRWNSASNWVNNRKPNENSIIIINSINQMTISTNVICKKLIIEPNGKVYINSNGILNVDTLIIYSDLEKIGQLYIKGILKSKTFLVKRLIKGGNTWHYIGSPTKNTHYSTILNRIYEYNVHNAKDNWQRWIIYRDTLKAGRGYDINKRFSDNLDGYITFTGEVNNELEYNINIEYYDGLETLEHEGWNLISNPYPTAIDWNKVILTNVEKAIYFWNYKTGKYDYYVDGISTGDASNIIPPTMGFFVKTNIGGNVKIPENSRVLHNNILNLKSYENNYKFSLKQGNSTDITILRFKENSTGNFDEEYDARKMFSDFNIYQKSSDNIPLSINSMNDTNDIYLYTKCYGNCQFINDMDFGTITDLITGEIVQLNDTFSFYGNGEEMRFKWSNVENLPTNINELTITLNIYPNPTSNYLNINRIGDFKIFDMNGNIILENYTNGKINVEKLKSGIYFLNIENEMVKVVKK